MNELKKILIQQILETQDERLLKMMLDILKLNDEQTGYHNIMESTFLSTGNTGDSEIQESIDSFFNPQHSNNDNY
jgi:hypothetical protein